MAFAKMTTYQEFLIMLQPLGIEIIYIFFTGKSDDHCKKKSKKNIAYPRIKINFNFCVYCVSTIDKL